jgi:hypothetical protein
MSRLSWEHEQYLEKQQREREYQRAEEQREAYGARAALEKTRQ